jgi:hypothetical protein
MSSRTYCLRAHAVPREVREEGFLLPEGILPSESLLLLYIFNEWHEGESVVEDGTIDPGAIDPAVICEVEEEEGGVRAQSLSFSVSSR